MAKILFYDLEATGVDNTRNGIHQISGFIEIDGKVRRSFNFKVAPFPEDEISAEALEIGGVTAEQIRKYKKPETVYKELMLMLSEYVDRYDKREKLFLCGFNNASFDVRFFRRFFETNNVGFFNAYFFSGSLDVMALASQYLIERRKDMSTFRLHSVASELGIFVDQSRLHDAMYDVELTRQIYRIVTGLEAENDLM